MLNSINNSRPRRVVALGAMLALGAVVGLVPAAGALAAGGDHTQTFTDNYHGTQSLATANPCNGDPLVGSEETNSVMHVTYFVAGDESWTTFTETDRFSVVDQVSGVTYTGHDTFWGKTNVNRQNSNSTFTSTVHTAGSDGSSISYHEVGHITMLPDGNVSVSFDKPSLTCG
jgi:hypothetical protein